MGLLRTGLASDRLGTLAMAATLLRRGSVQSPSSAWMMITEFIVDENTSATRRLGSSSKWRSAEFCQFASTLTEQNPVCCRRRRVLRGAKSGFLVRVLYIAQSRMQESSNADKRLMRHKCCARSCVPRCWLRSPSRAVLVHRY